MQRPAIYELIAQEVAHHKSHSIIDNEKKGRNDYPDHSGSLPPFEIEQRAAATEYPSDPSDERKPKLAESESVNRQQ